MLDSMQNTILNKPDSVMERRSSPSSDVRNLESKFENLFNKKKAQESAEVAQSEAKESPKAKPSKAKEAQKAVEAKETQKSPAQGSGVEFSDRTGEESKLAMQEKIAKSSKDKPTQSNPLIEALNASMAQAGGNQAAGAQAASSQGAQAKAAAGAQNAQAAQNAAQNISRVQMPMPQKINPMADSGAEVEHTLGDIEKLAKAKGLNPSKLSLQNEPEVGEAPKPKQRVIPASAKESINYEYENNVDRIAIVQRGTKKPKNITSKISAEYPRKSEDGDSGNGVSPTKERPQLS